MQLISLTIHVALRASSQLGAVRRSLRPDLYDTRPSNARIIYSPERRRI